MAYPGDSINLAFAQKNTRRGRVGRKIAHTLTASSDQGTLEPLKRIRRLTPRECLRLRDGQMNGLISFCLSNPTPSYTSRQETA